MVGGKSTSGATIMDYTQSDADVESGKRPQARAGAEEPLVMNQEQSDAAVATMDAPKTVDGKRERDVRFAQLTNKDI
jgi:hypothetical protein